MKSTRVLITGGSGYVGSRLAQKLSQEGEIVTVVDKVHPRERKINFPKKIKIIHGDLTSKVVCEICLKNIDYVIHLAANIGPLTYMRTFQADILQENCAIDANLYPAMRDNKIKAVIYSGSSMVFQNSTKFPYIEEDFWKINPPTNIYGASKLIGEYFCRSFKEQYGLDYVIMRYHNIYGAGEDAKGSTPGDIHVIPALVDKVLNGQYPIELIGDPMATRPFTYIDDAVNATALLFREAVKGNKKVINQDFNIGPRKATKIIDLAKLIWQLIGDGREFKYKTVLTKDITAVRREMDPSKIEKTVGWVPKTDLKEGIMVVASWLKTIRMQR